MSDDSDWLKKIAEERKRRREEAAAKKVKEKADAEKKVMDAADRQKVYDAGIEAFVKKIDAALADAARRWNALVDNPADRVRVTLAGPPTFAAEVESNSSTRVIVRFDAADKYLDLAYTMPTAGAIERQPWEIRVEKGKLVTSRATGLDVDGVDASAAAADILGYFFDQMK